ncbi:MULTISPECIES: HalOD1 output domain-containing protein [Halolamina]|uniref:Halobacterial output domain-containing protein n=1 Tax=Halolamina pelagica TaxID=699431 RepID=A0A1I5P1R2_9EURY|nr:MULTISPECIES: HalOD1 output domain-containing protein [Halolamina]SFP27790.1 hypothetical protein SAMN05216277_102299 [Halolamina pelagica]
MEGDPESVVDRVVKSVATTTETDPLELPPLYDAIDPDALAGVVDGMNRGHVVFAYAGCTVTVTDEGSITVDPDGVGYRCAESASVSD